MNTLDVEKFIKKYDMLRNGDRVVAGVSGGADSVCMLLILAELSVKMGFSVTAVHLNHMIRGSEADRDEEFVKKLTERLGVPFRCFRRNVPELAREERLSCEEAGRKLRYQLFHEVADEVGKDGRRTRIAVAHNKDDLAETIIFNMARGSSLKGLTGIRPVRDEIIRPILFADRNAIEEYLTEKGENYCTDSTNLSDDYTRNRIRHVIIPALRELNSGAVEHIFEMAGDVAEIYEDIDERAALLLRGSYIGKNESDKKAVSVRISASKLRESGRVASKEAVLGAMGILAGRRKDITRKHIESALDIAYGESGRSVSLPYDILARKHDGMLILELSEDSEADSEKEKKGPSGRLITEMVDNLDFTHFSKNKYTEIIDYDKIIGTLRVRTAEETDTIVINSSGGRKKLSKLFTDLKVDRVMRSCWPVVVDDKDVIWLPGLRLSEAYKIEEDSGKGLKMRYILEGGNPDE